MRINIIGAGAAGGLVGAILCRGGADVRILGRGDNLSAIRLAGGVKVITPNGTEWNAPVSVVGDWERLHVTADATFVAVTLPQLAGLRNAVWWLSNNAGPAIPICSGINALELLGRPANALPGTVDIGCYVKTPGTIVQYTSRVNINIAGASAAILAKRLRNYIAIKACRNADAMLWQKAAHIVPLAAVCAAFGIRGRAALRHEYRTWLKESVGEIMAAGLRRRIPVSESRAMFLLERTPGAAIPSPVRPLFDHGAAIDDTALPLLVAPFLDECPTVRALYDLARRQWMKPPASGA